MATRLDIEPPPVDVSINLVKSLFSTPSPEAVTDLIRKGQVSAKGAYEILRDLEKSHGEVVWVEWLRSELRLSGPVEIVVVSYKNQHTQIVPLVPVSEGEWLIDFDAIAAHCDPSFEDLAAGKSETGIIRGKIRKDSYHTSHYPESEWQCYAITNPNSLVTLYGYCPLGGPSNKALSAVGRRITKSMNETMDEDVALSILSSPVVFNVTLKIEKGDTGSAKQFKIESVLADGWSLGDRPLEDLYSDPKQ